MMKIILPKGTMYDGEILHYVQALNIPDFRGVKMRDELPSIPFKHECGILNFNTHDQQGSHWVCWFKCDNDRYYFDSFGEPPPVELLTYLKTYEELKNNSPVIRQSAVTVQRYESNECGSLCLFVLKKFSEKLKFSEIFTFLSQRYHHPAPLIIET